MREICTPGSAWGDEIKWPCLLGEAPARKRLRPQGSARATVVKTRLYHQPWNVKLYSAAIRKGLRDNQDDGECRGERIVPLLFVVGKI